MQIETHTHRETERQREERGEILKIQKIRNY